MSTINTSIPAQSSPASSADIRNNFAAAANDINNLQNQITSVITPGGSLTAAAVTGALTYTPENVANKGAANGYASLDATSSIPASQLPDAMTLTGSALTIGNLVTTSPSNLYGAATATGIGGHVVGTEIVGASGSSNIAIGRWDAAPNPVFLGMYKSRGATVGSHAAVLPGDSITTIYGAGDDGTNLNSLAAQISLQVDPSGAVLTGAVPGFISIATANPSGSMTNAITIDRNQAVSFLGTVNLPSATTLASPALTGVPVAPTATVGTNTTQLATTAFVNAQIGSGTANVTSFKTRVGAVVPTSGDYTVAQVTGAAPLASPAFTGSVTMANTLAVTGNASAGKVLAGVTSTIGSETLSSTGFAIIGRTNEGLFGDTGNSAVWGGSFNAVPFSVVTSNAVRATFDTVGNLGLGTATSAWASTYTALDIGSYLGLFTSTANTAQTGSFLTNNLYLNSSTLWTRKNAGFGSFINVGGPVDAFQVVYSPTGAAGSVATTQAAIIVDYNGNMSQGGASPSPWGSSVAAQDYGSCAGFMAIKSGIGGSFLMNNAYWNGTNFIYKNTGAISIYAQPGSSYAHQWEYAVSGTAGTTATILQAAQIDLNGSMLIGYTTTNSAAYKLQVNSQIFATSATIATSDQQFKTNVVDLVPGLPIINALQPREFDFIPDPVHNFPAGRQIGFVAQEVQTALVGTDYANALVFENTPMNEDGTEGTPFLGLADAGFTPLLVKAIQELSAQVTTLQAQVQALQSAA